MQRQRRILYCEMCGSPIMGRSFHLTVEGTELVVCERCFRRYMERAIPASTDLPLRLRLPSQQATRRAAATSKVEYKPPTLQAGTTAPRYTSRPLRPSGMRVRGVEELEVVDDYAERIRRARERLGWSRKVLAEKVRVSENVIRRIEDGSLVPPIDLARKLEKVLGIKLLEPVVEEYEYPSRSTRYTPLTLGDVAEIRED